eukprot:m.80784 g.80784  ORF g.80784 m.80784 type:complete len:204 (+) comp16315_c0_seq2:116-727(+)
MHFPMTAFVLCDPMGFATIFDHLSHVHWWAQGVPSTGYVTTYRTSGGNSRVDFQCSNNRNATRTMNAVQFRTAPYSAGHSGGPACRAVGAAGVNVGITSIGDGDGGDGTMWLSRSAMRTRFLVSTRIQHIALACAGRGSATLYRSMGSTTRQVLPIAGNALIGKAYTTNPAFLVAGTFVNTTVPCVMIIDGAVGGDEMLAFGY